ncbi:hypothetical protein [Actinokineospora bangkokensis]|uniref:hypothetical protein n=1 Tax=Actinokineospora bangkokensis TaxID=1193682 RepID=UPI001178BA43|nr:hypothetical protein [Actinokineospora bangkokensis]
MKIDMVLRIRLDDGRSGEVRWFTKQVQADVPHVPRVGEAVVLPGADGKTNLGARRVEEVMYPLNGQVHLDFRLDGVINDPEAQVAILRAAGYQELPPH